jgi:hypothetical protein
MSSAGGLPLPHPSVDDGRGSWSSSAALYRFVWAVKRGCLSQTALLAVPGREALALWIIGLDLREFSDSGSNVFSSGDEEMLDWVVASVRRGWTPREVLLWLFPSFGGLLYDLALDASIS